MRVSTTMVYDTGVRTINQQTARMLHNQQQVSTGRRIVAPSDDPVAAARALEITQASDVVVQFSRNRDNAQSALAIQETQLIGVTDMLARIRELTVQGGNGTLTEANRRLMTYELRARFEELLGYANARDGQGKYLFSGYMGDTRPYAGSVETGVEYYGDDGQRLLQVSPARVIEVSDSGRDIFERIRNGNGHFVTGVNVANQGTGVIDGGAVLDPSMWAAGQNPSLEIRFWVDSNHQLTPPGQTYYDIVDINTGNSVFTNSPPDDDPTSPGFTFTRQYASGQGIALFGTDPNGGGAPLDLGANVIITGEPASGDTFTIQPSTTQNIFDTLRQLILDLEQPALDAASQALLANRVGFALTNFDQAEQNILRIRAQIGARMNEVESLHGVNEDLNIQYQQAISQLQDLDYAKAISDLSRKQVDLEASQKSYAQITRLSLFNYL